MNEIFPRDAFCVRPQSTLVLGEDEAPEPDIAVVAGPCEEHQAELPSSALLVVEVADTSLLFDRGRKADIYARAGVPEWDDAILPLALEGRASVPLPAAALLPRRPAG
jgi:Uma2 family endonuclease